jgi:Tol biopolymer transport system component
VDQDTNDLPDIFVRDRDVSGNGIFDESGDVATYRVSVNSQGVESNGTSIFPIISGDGRSVIFRSAATNLTIDDTNDSDDVFLHIMQTGVTSLISAATDGTQGQGESQEGDISADGHYVLFSSIAANLTAGDTNNAWDAFLRDTQTSETTRVSVASDGNEGNGDSFADSISSDGRLIVFDSSASNLVAGDTNAFKDIFVIIRASTIIRRASINAQGTEGNGDSVSGSVSDDGLTVLFRSNADNLVPNDVNGGPDVFTSEIKLFLPIIIG